MPGVAITGKVKDRGDGSYGVGIVSGVSATPGVLVQQPDRDPVPMTPGGPAPTPAPDCSEAAGKLLDCLGLRDADVKKVRVKSVSVAIDLKNPKCCEEDDGTK
jgi:hypothetical protein